jgi:hypothetical protein
MMGMLGSFVIPPVVEIVIAKTKRGVIPQYLSAGLSLRHGGQRG